MAFQKRKWCLPPRCSAQFSGVTLPPYWIRTSRGLTRQLLSRTSNDGHCISCKQKRNSEDQGHSKLVDTCKICKSSKQRTEQSLFTSSGVACQSIGVKLFKLAHSLSQHLFEWADYTGASIMDRYPQPPILPHSLIQVWVGGGHILTRKKCFSLRFNCKPQWLCSTKSAVLVEQLWTTQKVKIQRLARSRRHSRPF